MSTIDKKAVLILNGNKYNLAQVLALGKAGPQISVTLKDINGIDSELTPDQQVTFEPLYPEEEQKTLIFYKQGGKYTILVGNHFITRAQSKGAIGGHLISSVALKKTKVQEGDSNNSNVVDIHKPVYESSFANTPRVTDKPRGYLGRNPDPNRSMNRRPEGQTTSAYGGVQVSYKK